MADETNNNETISESTITTTTTTTTTETIYPVTHAEAVLAGEAEPITHFEKVIAKYCTGGGSGTGDADGKIDKTSIVTTLDSTNTDTQVPSAKVVYDNVKDNRIKTYTDVTQLGLTTPTTTSDVFNAMPDNSMFMYKVSTISFTDVPTFGILMIHKRSKDGFHIELKRSFSISAARNDVFIAKLKGRDGTDLVWNRLISDIDIVTTLDSTSTDTQIPSAKAVYDNLQSLIVSLTQAEYDALTDAQKNNGTIYLITQ